MVQLDQRYNVDEALADPYFDITEGQGCNSIDTLNFGLELGRKLRQGLRTRLQRRKKWLVCGLVKFLPAVP